MQAIAVHAPVAAKPVSPAGPTLPATVLQSLPHSLRVWLAMALALYAAFWFELASPGAALLTVGILAQPRLGHALSRSIYRFIGTIVGGVGAVLLAPLFGQ